MALLKIYIKKKKKPENVNHRTTLLALLTQFQTCPIQEIDLVELQRIHYNCLSQCLLLRLSYT